MLVKFFVIECLTNMHVGSGNTTGGIVDLEVQRDEVTGLPVIFSSSLKGALREHFEQISKIDKDSVDSMFGTTEQKGQIRLLQAQLLSRPMRCKERPYVMVTHNYLLDELVKLIDFLKPEPDANKGNNCLDRFKCKDSKPEQGSQDEEVDKVYIEGIEESLPVMKLKKEESIAKLIFGDDEIVILPEDRVEIFRELPVIARNHLENGISQNLWYEEIIPQRSRFFFAALAEKGCEDLLNTFAEELEKQPVQIGANATIGYGYTKIYEIKCEQGK